MAALYTFYLCRRDGASTSFETFELGGDQDAAARALKMLADHPSCAYVTVWQDDRPLMEKHRTLAVGRRMDRSSSAANPNQDQSTFRDSREL